VIAPDLVLASHNDGKLREIRDLLSPLGLALTSAAELGLAEPEETGETFAENAAIKSEAAARATGQAALADDSGLIVHALNGAPGVRSARWAGPEKNFDFAITRVENELNRSVSNDRSAKFVCALALARPGQSTEIFEGEVHGTLTFPPRGTCGFGYDPIFIADGTAQTFGEMEPQRKLEISHRAQAFAKLAAFLKREKTPA
jgi:XTP/dITP diphosphohydrolase